MAKPKALAFDVFGTLVDWRSGVARDAGPVLADLRRPDIDPFALADAWRGLYQPKLEEVRSGRRPYVILDVLHREALEALLVTYGVSPEGVGEIPLAHLTSAWSRLDPWPEVPAALKRLRRLFPVVTLSNAHVALLVTLSRRAGLSWDALLGAEFSRIYKPMPEAYRVTARALGLEPRELALVAAHHSDLAAARRAGLITAYVRRPLEYGGAEAPDLAAAQIWDYQADNLDDLADQLG